MTKKFKNVFLTGSIFNIFFQRVYAANIEMTFDKAVLIGSIFLIGLGLALIVFSKFNEKKDNFDEPVKSKEKSTKDVDKKEKSTTNNKNTVDTIFKELPTFSANQFYKEVFEDIKEYINNNISKDEIVDKITLLDKAIIDFEKNNNKYTITSTYKVKYEITYNSDKTDEKDQHANTVTSSYTVISKNDTSEAKVVTKCPTCFGKIKDPTKLRCEYCDCILPANSGKKEKWITKDIKMDNE